MTFTRAFPATTTAYTPPTQATPQISGSRLSLVARRGRAVRGAPVEAGRQVERVDLDEELHKRLGEDIKEDPPQLEEVGAEQRFVAGDDVKDVPE